MSKKREWKYNLSYEIKAFFPNHLNNISWTQTISYSFFSNLLITIRHEFNFSLSKSCWTDRPTDIILLYTFFKYKVNIGKLHMYFIYRVFIKYCVFFPENFVIFLNSASSAAALVFYLPGMCTHTGTEGKQKGRNTLKSSKKHSI